MSVLDFLRNAATVAGAGVEGYGKDQQISAAKVLANAKAQRDAENDRVTNLLKQREINTPRLGDPNYAEAIGKAAGSEAAARVPSAVDQAAQIGTAAATREQATHAANRRFDLDNPEPHYTPTTIGGDPNVPGSGEVVSVNTATGQRGPTIGTAKPNVSSAKLTDPQEKSYLFYNLMKNAEPEITASLQSGTIRPSAVSAYLGAGQLGDVPIIGKAIGTVAKPAANANLNEEEQKLIRAGKDFTAGVLRKESGAAVTASELAETMERYFPGMFGDKPGLTDAKNLARQQYMKTMEQEATPAIRYYGAQGGGKAAPAGHVPSFEEWLKTQGPPDA